MTPAQFMYIAAMLITILGFSIATWIRVVTIYKKLGVGVKGREP